MSLAFKGLLILAIPLILQLALIGGLFHLHDKAEQYAVRAGHARNLSSGLSRWGSRCHATIERADQAMNGHTPLSELGVTDADQLINEERDLEKELEISFKNNVFDRRTYSTALESIQSATQAAERLCSLVDKNSGLDPNSDQFKKNLDEFRRQQDKSSGVLTTLGELGYGKVLMPPEFWSRDRSAWVALAVIGTVINIFVVLMLGLFFNRSIINRVLIILDNSLRLASQRQLHPPLRGADEISRLDLAFHSMARALSEALHKQRSLTENARDVICSIDANGSFLAINNASKSLFGYTPDELVGGNLLNLLPDEDAPQVVKQLQVAQGGVREHAFETRAIRRDRSVVDVLWSASWSESENSLFCVAHDITERKNAERLRQEVVQMVSHDLRTPLTTVQGFHSMLADGAFGPISDKAAHFLDAAQRNTARMLDLIEDLLDIEKMEAGRLELNKTTVAIADVFKQSLQSVDHIAQARGVLLKAESTDISVVADGARLIQIVVNLLSNAIKFTPAGAKVELSAITIGGFVEIRIKDQGRGIPPNMLQSIFDRFKQVSSKDATGRSGFGLGLAICKALVELHGGVISVESEQGVGSTFSFRIPASGNSVLQLNKDQQFQKMSS